MVPVYIGVDQTGAIDKKGQPKPLPACYIRDNKITFIYLNHFSKNEILEKTQCNSEEAPVICVDCVLGLPKKVKITWRDALTLIQSNPGYGRSPAQAFFRKLSQGQIFQRQVEVLCQANSVFKEKPFQKNIQTGTYRIWKDISLSAEDFYVPFLSEKPSLVSLPIYEGYPSFSWRLLFETKNREPQNLKKIMAERFPLLHFTSAHQEQVLHDPNLGDALVLALTLKTFDFKVLVPQAPEGWILGFPQPS